MNIFFSFRCRPLPIQKTRIFQIILLIYLKVNYFITFFSSQPPVNPKLSFIDGNIFVFLIIFLSYLFINKFVRQDLVQVCLSSFKLN